MKINATPRFLYHVFQKYVTYSLWMMHTPITMAITQSTTAVGQSIPAVWAQVAATPEATFMSSPYPWVVHCAD